MRSAAAVLLALAAAAARAELPPESRVGAQYAGYALDNDTPDWREYTLMAATRLAGGHALALDAMSVERFGVADTQGVLTYRKTWDEGWAVEVQGGGGSPHDVLPAWLGAVRVERRAGLATFGVGYKRTHYSDVAVDLLTGALDLEGRHAYGRYTTYYGELDVGGSATSHAFEAGFPYGERSRIGVGYVTGDEANRVSADLVVISDIETLFLNGQHWLGPHWGILYGAERHEQGMAYTREGARIGLVRRF